MDERLKCLNVNTKNDCFEYHCLNKAAGVTSNHLNLLLDKKYI